jgi:SAM-dependent methyltransferase
MPLFAPLIRGLVPAGGSTVDIGGGRHPLFSPAEKAELGLTVTGVDVSEAEVKLAPPGAYDRVVIGDAATMAGVPSSSADIAYSRAVAEHLENPRAMFQEIHRILKPGGHSAHYIPNKWALFAMVNAALPAHLSRRILYATRPGAEEWAGFTSYYRDTTPRAMERMFKQIGFREVRVLPYYHADYLDFLFPAHLGYVMWQSVGRWLSIAGTCESFAIVGRK